MLFCLLRETRCVEPAEHDGNVFVPESIGNGIGTWCGRGDIVDEDDVVRTVEIYRGVSFIGNGDLMLFWGDRGKLTGLQCRKNGEGGQQCFLKEFVPCASHPNGLNDEYVHCSSVENEETAI